MRVAGGDQACRGGQLGINQAVSGVVRGDQAGRQKWLGAIRKAGRRAVGSQQSWIMRGMSDCLNEQ